MTSADSPRHRFRSALDSGEIVVAPLTLEPVVARLTESLGFGAGYVSGGALGYSLAVSEALLSVHELATVVHQLTQRSNLPIIVDGGVGFGDPVHVTRAMWEFEAAGAAAVELEDQVAPKRVSHHRGIEHLVSTAEMVAKIEAAVAARRDPDFLIIARTGGIRHEGLDAGLARADAYRAAGADVLLLFPADEQQYAELPGRFDVPLAAMVGVDAHSPAKLGALGWSLLIDPFTGQVVAYDAVRAAYASIAQSGGSGHDFKALMSTYRDLPTMAGLEELYDIERRTTEPGT